MSRPVNPVFADTVRRLWVAGPARETELGYIAILAAVLVLAWPKNTVHHLIIEQMSVNTLAVVVTVLGIGLSYFSIRLAGEELTEPEQATLREWAVATPVSLSRILAGYLAAHLAQMLHALALALPIVLIGWSILPAPAWHLWSCIGVAMLQASAFRLGVAALTLYVGHITGVVLIVGRGALIAVYLLALHGLLAPGHAGLSFELLANRANRDGLAASRLAGDVALSGAGDLILGWSIGCVVALLVLWRALAAQRERSTESSSG